MTNNPISSYCSDVRVSVEKVGGGKNWEKNNRRGASINNKDMGSLSTLND